MNNWKCPKCNRIFQRKNQMHSCKSFPIEKHFENKDPAKEVYKYLFKVVNKKVGKCKEISLPCCIHWFGNYDFIALLPKKDKLEVRFALNRKINSPRVFNNFPPSSKYYMICLYIQSKDEVDEELLKWLKESYTLKSL
jgi:hypothetical protein